MGHTKCVNSRSCKRHNIHNGQHLKNAQNRLRKQIGGTQILNRLKRLNMKITQDQDTLKPTHTHTHTHTHTCARVYTRTRLNKKQSNKKIKKIPIRNTLAYKINHNTYISLGIKQKRLLATCFWGRVSESHYVSKQIDCQFFLFEMP